jgi:CheY-like chemotaxis protein
MSHEQVLILEDRAEHAAVISQDLMREGYVVDIVRTAGVDATIDAAEEAAARGVRKMVFDIRLFGRGDLTGLRALQRVKRKYPSVCAVVCSEIGPAIRDWAYESDADAVITKRTAQLHAASYEIIAHFVRHDAGHKAVTFAGLWVGSPLAFASAASWWVWNAGITLQFLTRGGVILLPWILALVFVLTVSVAEANKEPWIRGKRLFTEFLAFRWWLITALAGGVVYDVFKKMWG